MPVDKICPLFLIFYKTENNTCIKSNCEFWSGDMKMCGITLGMLAILSIADALRGISELIKNHYPE
jgi:hypothetical protein